MFKTTVGFNEVLQFPTMEFTYVIDALVWQALQDFANLGDIGEATKWYNNARLTEDGYAFRLGMYTIKIVKKGYKVTLHEERSTKNEDAETDLGK